MEEGRGEGEWKIREGELVTNNPAALTIQRDDETFEKLENEPRRRNLFPSLFVAPSSPSAFRFFLIQYRRQCVY